MCEQLNTDITVQLFFCLQTFMLLSGRNEQSSHLNAARSVVARRPKQYSSTVLDTSCSLVRHGGDARGKARARPLDRRRRRLLSRRRRYGAADDEEEADAFSNLRYFRTGSGHRRRRNSDGDLGVDDDDDVSSSTSYVRGGGTTVYFLHSGGCRTELKGG